MATSLVNAESILALEIGTITTRAILFDVVDGRYRFVSSGSAPTTAGAPVSDAGQGVRFALDQLQAVSGRNLVGADGHLIVPSQANGSGVDICVATVSAGPPLRVVAIGLLDDISAESAQHLATTTYASLVETINLGDRRKTAARLDAILRVRPDLVIITGGTEGGASRSVHAMLEAVGLACYLLPKEQRPEVLFAGNSSMAARVQESLGSLVSLHIAPNVRPTLDIEQLTPAQPALCQVYRHVRARKIRGVQEVDLWTGGKLMPTASAFGRTIRFISKEYAKTNKGVLGIDVGSSATTVASAFNGELVQGVYTKYGVGDSLQSMMSDVPLEDITRWISEVVTPQAVRDYIYNKSFYPTSIPVTPEDLAIEQALATQAMFKAVNNIAGNLPKNAPRSAPHLLPWYEPIIATGSVLTQAPTRAQSLMMILNGIQPTGVTTIALDRNNLAAALGAAAAASPLLMIQSLDANNFMNLCTVISPVGTAAVGTPILHIKVTYADGSQTSVDVKYGTMEVIRIPSGQSANLYLQPLHRFEVGMGGPGRGGNVKVLGGALGVVIDARGRPLRFSVEPTRQREYHNKWLWLLGS